MLHILLDKRAHILLKKDKEITCIFCSEKSSDFMLKDEAVNSGVCSPCFYRYKLLEAIKNDAEGLLERYYVETFPVYAKALKNSLQNFRLYAKEK